MPKIKLPEEMTKEEILAEYLEMRKLLDQLSKKDLELEKKFSDLQVNYNDLKLQHDVLKEKYKKQIAAKY